MARKIFFIGNILLCEAFQCDILIMLYYNKQLTPKAKIISSFCEDYTVADKGIQ